MTSRSTFLSALSGITASVVALTSCTVGPDFTRPDSPQVKQYTSGQEPSETRAADGKAQRFEKGARVPENWWKLFNSSKLDPIVIGALAKNQTLEVALASLRQSQENLMAGQGVYYPQVNAGVGVSRQKANPANIGIKAPPTLFNLFTASSSISYVLDIFGGERRAIEGLKAQEDAKRSTVLATYLTLTGNVVNAVIARAAYEAEVEATHGIIEAEKEQVSLTAANYKGGTAPYASLLSLKSQLATTEASLPPLLQRLNETDHLLAVLAGEMPAEWIPPTLSLKDLHLPETLPQSLPSDLVRQRPDLLLAESELHVASAQIGVATAALFPSFTLSGTLGLNGTSAGDLFTGRSSFWDIGGNLTGPLFHGGTLRAQKQAAVEAFNGAFANYKQTVLTAIQQVADTLRALEHDAELVQAQSDSLASAEGALKIVQANYRAGTAGYLQLLTANTQHFQAKFGYLQGVAQRYQDTVALFVALGGGWWNSPNTETEKLVKDIAQ